MSDMISHKWTRYLIEKREDVPTCKHWQAIRFGMRYESVPAYDAHESPYERQVPDVEVYVFKEREHLDAFVREATIAGESFVFQRVEVGAAVVRVDVEISDP